MSVSSVQLFSIASFRCIAIAVVVVFGLSSPGASAQVTNTAAINATKNELQKCEQAYERARAEYAKINADPGNFTAAQRESAESSLVDARICIDELLKEISRLENEENTGTNVVGGRTADGGQWGQIVAGANNLQINIGKLKLLPAKPK